MGRQAAQEGTSPAQAISLLERAGTIQALPVSTARGSVDLDRAGTHSPIKDVTQARSVHLQPAHANIMAYTIGDLHSATLLDVFFRCDDYATRPHGGLERRILAVALQEVLIDIDGYHDVSGSSPPATAKSGEGRQPSEALPQSAAPSQDAGASAELKAGQEAKQYTQGDEGGHSREPSVSTYLQSSHNDAFPLGSDLRPLELSYVPA